MDGPNDPAPQRRVPELSQDLLVELAHARTLESLEKDRRATFAIVLAITTLMVTGGGFLVQMKPCPM